MQTKLTHCPLCSSLRIGELLVGYDRMEARREDYAYSRCRSCHLVFMNPLPSLKEIPGLYPKAYPPHQLDRMEKPQKWINRLFIKWFYSVESYARPAVIRMPFRLLAGRVMRLVMEPQGTNRLLDVGCGSGALLKIHQDMGWTVKGVEIDEKAWKTCRSIGLEVHHGTLLDKPFAGDKFDVILFSHVIEHLLDPVEVLRVAATYLTPAGKIVLVTPNTRALSFSIYGACWYSLDAPRHLLLFDHRSMRHLCDKAGLTIRRIQTECISTYWCESRHLFKTQGPCLPNSLEERMSLVDSSEKQKQPYKAFRKIVSPLCSVAAKLGKGDNLRVELGVR